jgi:hypothetical protein
MAKKSTAKKKAPVKKKSPAKKKAAGDDYDSEEGPEYIEEDLDAMEDDMLGGEDTDAKPREDDEILSMLRIVECGMCDGSSSKENCKVREQFGCPPEKADL